MTRQSLRFGVLCDGLLLEAWQSSAIAQLVSSGCADLALVIFGHAGGRGMRATLRARCAELVQRRGRGMRATILTDCRDLFGGAERVRCQTHPQRRDADFAPNDVDVIASHRLDFIISFQSERPSGNILSAARYGVWVYDFAQERSSVPAASGPPTTETYVHTLQVALLRLLGPQTGVSLFHGVFPRRSAGAPTADVMRWTAAAFCLRVCRAIQSGDLSLVHSTVIQSIAIADGWSATLRVVLWPAVHGLMDSLKSRLHKWFCYDVWNIGLVNMTVARLCDAGRLTDVRWSPYQSGSQYVADPFVLRDQDGLLLLVERFDYGRTWKGRISRCAVTPNDEWSELEDALDRDYHLSYPYILRCQGEVYCIPENHEAGRCDLYRVTASGDFEFVRTILDGCAVIDPTIVFHEGFWWLFFTRGGSVELYAYYADTLAAGWREHALNPLKCDVTSARPAGSPFRCHGHLYRPAQDCSRTYGGAVAINRIVELRPDRFREEVVCRIAPEPGGAYPHGFHTLNVLDRTCLVDGKRRVIDPTWILRGWVFGARTRERRKSLQHGTG